MTAQLRLPLPPLAPADTAAGQRLLALRAQYGEAAALRAACEDKDKDERRTGCGATSDRM